MYPVGSIYINAASTSNPSALMGFGTWVEFGAGRVLIGQNASDAAFDTLEETGGSKDAVVVSHNHTASSTVYDPGHSHAVTAYTVGGNLFLQPSGQVSSNTSLQTGGSYTGISVGTSIGVTGSSGTNANLQPYIVVKMWKRTA